MSEACASRAEAGIATAAPSRVSESAETETVEAATGFEKDSVHLREPNTSPLSESVAVGASESIVTVDVNFATPATPAAFRTRAASISIVWSFGPRRFAIVSSSPVTRKLVFALLSAVTVTSSPTAMPSILIAA